MRTLAAGILAFALVLPAAGFAADYTVQHDASKLSFSGSFQGSGFDGSFSQWTAAISYDPENLAASHFDVTVDLTSVSTGDKDRDSALPGKDFFNVAAYPKAHYVTTGFHRSGNQVVADGKLTLHGVSKPVSMQVNFKLQGSNATLDIAGTIQRLDFAVGGGDYADTSVIGPEVKITAHLQLAPK